MLINKYNVKANISHQGDHNWTMKNPEILADMRATEETIYDDIFKQLGSQ